MPCNGVCQDDMMLCGVNNDMNEHKYMCFSEVMFSHNFPQFDRFCSERQRGDVTRFPLLQGGMSPPQPALRCDFIF